MQWLAVSLVLSVVLTVVLNVGLRLFPRAGDEIGRRMTDFATRPMEEPGDGRVRVWFPWKAMLVGSLILTVLVNVLLRIG